MTNEQAKLCKIIMRYKKLTVILKKSGVPNYLDLQEILGPKNIDFSDTQMNDNTIVTLENPIIEELEQRRSRSIDHLFTRTLSIMAIIISVIALLGELGILRLQ